MILSQNWYQMMPMKKLRNYKLIRVNRLFHMFASVRDYQVEEARKDCRGLEIWWRNEHIHVPYEDLDKCYHNNEVYSSKHKVGQTYKLLDYDWNSFKRKTPIQETLL